MNTSVQADMDLTSWGMDQPGALWVLSIMQGGGRGQPKGALQFDVGEGSLVGQTTLTDGQWHHLAVVLPVLDLPRMKDILIYVDGHIESNSMILDAPIDTMAGGDVRFGRRAGDTWTPFEGLLDDVRIDSRALTAEEVVELAGAIE
jgi:hypothetical protein